MSCDKIFQSGHGKHWCGTCIDEITDGCVNRCLAVGLCNWKPKDVLVKGSNKNSLKLKGDMYL